MSVIKVLVSYGTGFTMGSFYLYSKKFGKLTKNVSPKRIYAKYFIIIVLGIGLSH